MGFQDNLRQIGRGIGDIFTAPVGLVVDTIRAVGSDSYNPGFFGVFGPSTERLITGVAGVAEGTKLTSALGSIGDTPVGDAFVGFWEEVELLYSTEFQLEKGRTAGLFGAFGAEPGDVSLQRFAGVGPNLVGSGVRGALQGDFSRIDPITAWRKTAEQSPGQAIYESILTDFSLLQPSQQDEVRASAHYNLISGTLDLVSRWYLSPEVWLGKGLGKLRRTAFIFNTEQGLKRAARAGLGLKSTDETVGGIRAYSLGDDAPVEVYYVPRSSHLEQLVEEGSLVIKQGADELLDADGPLTLSRAATAGESTGKGRIERVGAELDEAASKLEIPPGMDPGLVVFQDYLEKGLGDRVSGRVGALGGTATGAPGATTDVVTRIDDLLKAVEAGDPAATQGLIRALRKGGASDDFVDHIVDQLDNINTAEALGRINGKVASEGMLGERAGRVGRSPRFIGQSDRALHLTSSLDEAKRYASALYAADPSDVPVLLRIDANKMPVVYTDVNVPIKGLKGDETFFTTAEKLRNQDVTVQRLRPQELDPALQFQVSSAGVVDHLAPGGTLNQRYFKFDGTPIEPDDLVNMGDMLDDFKLLMSNSTIDGQRYLAARTQAENIASQGKGFYDHALNSRVIHQVVNRMDGMNAAEIRFAFLQKNPMGDIIASDLAAATTFAERRTILLAYMGHRLPEIDQLAPVMRAKLDIMLKELDNIKQGQPANSVMDMMLDKPGKWTDMAPEQQIKMAQEVVDGLEDQIRLATVLERASESGILGQISMPYGRLAAQRFRRTAFYQENILARPIRVTTEMKPHRFINVRDGQSSIQLRRQLEEASSLGISTAEIEGILGRYMKRGTIDSQRIRIVEEAENLIIARAAKKAGLEPKELQDLIAHAEFGRRRVQQTLQSRKYASGKKDILPIPNEITGEIDMLNMPFLETQLQAWMSLADVKMIKRAASEVGRLRNRYGGKAITGALDSFYHIWKPSVLLRGGWTLRVVSDEQLRILAKMGSLTNHLAAISLGEKPHIIGAAFQRGTKEAVGTSGVKVTKPALTGGQRAGELAALATGTRPITGLGVRTADLYTQIARSLKLIDEDVYAEMKKISGPENLVSARVGHGGPNESIIHELETMMGRSEASYLNHLRVRSTGQWHSIGPGMDGYGDAWGRVLADQFGKSLPGRQITQSIVAAMKKGKIEARAFDDILDNAAIPEIVNNFTKWLKTTREGQEIARQIPWRSNHPERWAEDLIEELQGYSGGFNPELLDGVLKQKVTAQMLEKIDDAWRPQEVHAEIVSQLTGHKSIVNEFFSDFFATTFDLLGRLPTDTLSRQPMFKQVFGVEMVRMKKIQLAQGVEITEDSLLIMEKAARATAITETRTLLYDLAEVSRLGDMMRHLTPFFSAWQEVITRWAGLAFNDPSIIARARMIWKAPNRADMVYTDDEGNEFIQFRLSPKMTDQLGLTGWAKYVAEGGARVGKSSFNLVLNSPLPGVGPLIQYPVNEVVKNKPELEDALRFLLPFGVTTNTASIFLSPLVRQLQTEMAGPSGDLAYKRAFADALTWMDLQYRTGDRVERPSEKEAHDIANKLRTLRLFTRLASPVQPIFDSPLQPYIDTYRDLIDNLGPEDADEAFLNEHGNEFFAVTLSRTVSATGIPPTVEAQVARRRFVEIIDKYPEYGRLIIGDDALGEFSTGAFAAQLQTPIDPDNPNSEMERVYRSTELDPRNGKIIEVDRRLGWQEYIQAMDMIDLERKRLGLPNLRVQRAAGLAEAKRKVIEYVATKYPSWWDDYNTRDDLKWDRRINSLREISKVPTLNARADIMGLQDYLEVRGLILQELNRRKLAGGASTLEAVDNEDLRGVWDTMIFRILDDNIAFQPLYFRYLEGDTLQLRTQSG